MCFKSAAEGDELNFFLGIKNPVQFPRFALSPWSQPGTVDFAFRT